MCGFERTPKVQIALKFSCFFKINHQIDNQNQQLNEQWFLIRGKNWKTPRKCGRIFGDIGSI